MGRHYYGDIEGKFWFGVQKSNCAERFGGELRLSYDFDSESGDLENVNMELERIKENLGVYLSKIDKFFKLNKDGYTNEKLSEFLGVNENRLRFLLSDYADYKFGLKIKKCLIKKGRCQFECEC
jgi:hypothetical protein